MTFCHLHVHTRFSVCDGLSDPFKLVAKAKADGQEAIALTDHGTLGGIVQFASACKKNNIKPIYGLEAYTRTWDHSLPLPDKLPNSHLILLAKNKTGLMSLFKILRDSEYSHITNKQVISMNLLKENKEGLIASSACLYGFLSRMIATDGILTGKLKHREQIYSMLNPLPTPYKGELMDSAIKFVSLMKELFGDDFYLEIQDHGLPEQEYVNEYIMQLSDDFGIKAFCSNDVHYIEPEDAISASFLSPINRRVRGIGEVKLLTSSHLKTIKEMSQTFHKDLMNVTSEIADKVEDNIFVPCKRDPVFDSGKRTSDGLLREVAYVKLDEKFGGMPPTEYVERLDRELNVLASLGHSDYMLMTWDIVKTTKERSGETPGPGRGSAAGSLVAWLLEITAIDPIPHKLFFDRFISPARYVVNKESLDFGAQE